MVPWRIVPGENDLVSPLALAGAAVAEDNSRPNCDCRRGREGAINQLTILELNGHRLVGAFHQKAENAVSCQPHGETWELGHGAWEQAPLPPQLRANSHLKTHRTSFMVLVLRSGCGKSFQGVFSTTRNSRSWAQYS